MTSTPDIKTVETIDQNTRRTITWNVDVVMDNEGTQIQAQYGWTHSLGLSRPKGRRSYIAHAVIVGGEVTKLSTPVKVF